MSKIGFLIVTFTALGLMVLSAWREHRGKRWCSQGLCYQCGAHLAPGAKPVPLSLLSPGNKVRICAGCTKERAIQRWMLASFALLGLMAFGVWWFVRQP
jgi:hypothetical protein